MVSPSRRRADVDDGAAGEPGEEVVGVAVCHAVGDEPVGMPLAERGTEFRRVRSVGELDVAVPERRRRAHNAGEQLVG